ncbi:hypothetical protein D3C79_990940 [compost metagenome]
MSRIGEIAVNLDHVIEVRACRDQNGFKVAQGLAHLLFEAFGLLVQSACGGYLTGSEHQMAADHCLGVRTDRADCAGCCLDTLHE